MQTIQNLQITGLFRKSAIFVCSILRLQLRMTALSADVMSRSATEEQWHAVNTSRQVKDLVFNKDLFAKSKVSYVMVEPVFVTLRVYFQIKANKILKIKKYKWHELMTKNHIGLPYKF